MAWSFNWHEQDDLAGVLVRSSCVSVAAIFDGGGGKLFDGLPASASRTL
jgi:hypothetical protein